MTSFSANPGHTHTHTHRPTAPAFYLFFFFLAPTIISYNNLCPHAVGPDSKLPRGVKTGPAFRVHTTKTPPVTFFTISSILCFFLGHKSLRPAQNQYVLRALLCPPAAAVYGGRPCWLAELWTLKQMVLLPLVRWLFAFSARGQGEGTEACVYSQSLYDSGFMWTLPLRHYSASPFLKFDNFTCTESCCPVGIKRSNPFRSCC